MVDVLRPNLNSETVKVAGPFDERRRKLSWRAIV